MHFQGIVLSDMADKPAFLEFKLHYREMNFPAMLTDIASWPDDVDLDKAMAAMARLIEIACDDERTPDNYKIKAAEMAATCEETIRVRLLLDLDRSKMLQFKQYVIAIHQRLQFARYPEIANLIIDRSRRL